MKSLSLKKVNGSIFVTTIVLSLALALIVGQIKDSGVSADSAKPATTNSQQSKFNLYGPDKHPGFTKPDGSVDDRGEKDFFRLGKKGELGNSGNYCNDQTAHLWLYVHNSLAAEKNGDNFEGSAVARNTRIHIGTVNPWDSPGQLELTASIWADNSEMTKNSLTISCDQATEPGTAISFTPDYDNIALISNAPSHEKHGQLKIVGDIFSSASSEVEGESREAGAQYGYSADGLVPGCWDYAAIIKIPVVVKVSVDETLPEEPAADEPAADMPKTITDTSTETPDPANSSTAIATSILAAVMVLTISYIYQATKPRR